MKKELRKIIFWTHLSAGMLVGLVIFYLSLSGLLLVFKPQLLNWNLPGSASVMPTEMALENFRQRRPDTKISAVVIWKERGFFEIQAGKNKFLVDSVSGQEVNYKNPGLNSFFETLLNLHRWFSIENSGDHQIAKGFKGTCMLVFMLLLISGIYLWWPQGVKFLNLKLKDKARQWNQHNVIGFWSAPFLLVVSVTGLVMAHEWANRLLFTMTLSEPPALALKKSDRAPEEVSLKNTELLFADLTQRVPEWVSVNLKFSDSDEINVQVEQPVGLWVTARAPLQFNRQTGQILAFEPYSDWSTGRQLRIWMKPLHTGEAGGIFGEILAALAAFGAIVLVWTGFQMAYRRFSIYRRGL